MRRLDAERSGGAALDFVDDPRHKRSRASPAKGRHG
jgi:hypothetical protein